MRSVERLPSATPILRILTIAIIASMGFQNCSPSFHADNSIGEDQTLESQSYQPGPTDQLGTQNLAPLPNSISTSQQGTMWPSTGQSTQTENRETLDLATFLDSSRIPTQYSTVNNFQNLGRFDLGSTIINTKFNQIDNFEVFVITSSMILIRYETAPKIFGEASSSTNAVRRFMSTPVHLADLKGTSPFPETGNLGAAWFKRYVTPKEQNQVFVASQAIDHFTFSNGNIRETTSSSAYLPIYYWFSFKASNQRFSFMNANSQFGDVLMISQQWSRCNIEQYEYARGYGLIGWRSLIAESCLSSPSNADRVEYKNFFYETPRFETFYLDQGTRLSNDFFLDVYSGRVINTYMPGKVFIEDYPYRSTSPNEQVVARFRPARMNCVDRLASLPIYTTTHAEKIEFAYCWVMKRTVDSTGLSYWISKSLTIRDLVKNLFKSAELKDKFMGGVDYQSQETSQFIDNLYKYLLNRNADSAGRTYWIKMIDENRVTRDAVIDNFVSSPDFRSQTGTLLDE